MKRGARIHPDGRHGKCGAGHLTVFVRHEASVVGRWAFPRSRKVYPLSASVVSRIRNGWPMAELVAVLRAADRRGVRTIANYIAREADKLDPQPSTSTLWMEAINRYERGAR